MSHDAPFHHLSTIPITSFIRCILDDCKLMLQTLEAIWPEVQWKPSLEELTREIAPNPRSLAHRRPVKAYRSPMLTDPVIFSQPENYGFR